MRVLYCLGLLLLAPPVAAQVDMQLPVGTRVPIITTTVLSSATTQKGSHFTLAVDSAVTVFGVPLIAKGALVWGTVLKADPAGRFGHAGLLTVAVDSVQAVDGQHLRLVGSTASKVGGGPTGAAASAANAVASIPIAGSAIGFFQHGNDVVYQVGTRFSMVTMADMVIHVPDSLIKKAAPAGSDSTTSHPDSTASHPNGTVPGKDSTSR